MSERQKHGFLYETIIFKKYNLNDINKKYTSKWDAYEKDGKIPVSIKCIKHKSGVDFGDLKRQTTVNEDFILYVGFWKGEKTKIVDEYRILIDHKKWNTYFGNKNIIKKMLLELKTISNNRIDDFKWKEFRIKYKKLYGDSIITLRFKRDHKKQKRIQCGISNQNFFNIVLKENKILTLNG